MTFKNISINQLLMGGNGLLVLLIIILGLGSIFSNEELAEESKIAIASQESISELYNAIIINKNIQNGNASNTESFFSIADTLKSNLTKIKDKISVEADREKLTKVIQEANEWENSIKEVFNIIESRSEKDVILVDKVQNIKLVIDKIISIESEFSRQQIANGSFSMDTYENILNMSNLKVKIEEIFDKSGRYVFTSNRHVQLQIEPKWLGGIDDLIKIAKDSAVKIKSKQTNRALVQVTSLAIVYRDLVEEYISLTNSQDDALNRAIKNERNIATSLTNLSKTSKQLFQNMSENSQTRVIWLLVVILFVAVSLSLYVMKHASGILNKISDILISMSIGEFRVKLSSDPNDLNGMNKPLLITIKQISTLLKEIGSISDNVASASEELTAVMQNTAKNTQSELAQVEEISTAISELSSTSKEVSSNAVQAEDETRKALNNVEQGNKTLEQSIVLTQNINNSVQETAGMIEELKNSAIDIGEVTNVISSISEQTNLLALNAAIEAARAGEQGRGFAVVADEVRNLAGKTQESTKNIQEIISKLQAQSEKANENMIANVTSIRELVELSENVKASFDDISHSVQAISDINTLVATASQEQYSVTEDIAKNTTRTFDLVNENVAAVNQTQQAAQELASLAEKQNQELSFFKLV